MKWYPNIAIAIIDALKTIFNEGEQADKVIQKLLRSNRKWGSRDRKFIAKALYDIIRWKRLYEYLSNEDIYTILGKWKALGVWAIHNNIDLPDWDEFKDLDSDEIQNRLSTLNNPAIKQSLPDWLYNTGKEQLGAQNWDLELEALNQEAELYIRTNTLKVNKEKLQQILLKEGIETDDVTDATDALRIKNKKKLTHLKSYKDGLFEIQDLSSQLVAPFTAVKPGMTVIDACAGAGGKTLHIAAMMKNKGEIYAYDIYESKIKELKKRARRNKVQNIVEAKVINRKIIEKNKHKADILLLDAPCSSLGTLKRKPDLKWKLNLDKLQKINTLQLNILEQYEQMLKPGGTLIYVTCSILPQENQDIVNKFLKKHKNFTFVIAKNIFPSKFEGDGFYMAKLIKNK